MRAPRIRVQPCAVPWATGRSALAAADFTPPVELVEKMMRYNKSLGDAGVLLSLDGLAPPAAGARVRFGGGKPTVVDGPSIESKELMGGNG